jgi:hypothetical protein
VETESEICTRYEAELAAIATLDRAYYLNATATSADRANYFRRQNNLEQIRVRFYTELRMVRHSETTEPGIVRVRVNDRAITSAPQCTLSHDLNNYLSVLIGRLELLADFVSEDAGGAQHLTAIFDMAQAMAERIHDNVCRFSLIVTPGH